MRTLKLLLVAVAVLWSTIWCGRADAGAPFFMGLGDLPGGSFDSRAYGISADGTVVVGSSNTESGTEAFRWTEDTGIVGLGGPSSAYDVSADGSVIVGQWGSQAFRWTQGTGLVGLGDIPRGLFLSFANAVSADGSIVVGRGSTDFCSHFGCQNIYAPFRWTQNSGMVRIGSGTAMDISDDGSVIVGQWGFQAMRWTQDGGTVGLGDLPGGSLNSHAYGVSADGSVIVGQGNSASGAEAFRWTQSSGMVGLGILSGFDFSLAQDVSADGSIVIGSVGFGTNTYAGTFIWDAAHGMRNLSDVLINDFDLGASLAGWSLDYASAISADGRVIVGYGTNPNGNTEAWIARLALEPTLPGDYNNNGTVDGADYVLWRKHNNTAVTLPNDATPGTSPADYTVWRTNFGQPPGSGSGASADAAVPEPATFLLLMFGVTGGCLPRHRTHRKSRKLINA